MQLPPQYQRQVYDGAPDLAANLRAEVARSGVEVEHLLTRIPMAPSTYYRRLAVPGSFRWGELVAFARVLDVPISRLVARAGAGS